MPIYKKVNKDFFKKWTREMAYVLGFFAADGYMTINKRGGGYWCIDIGDKKHIENIKKVIQSDHKISVRKRKNGEYTTYRIQIGSSEICNDLKKLGFGERKTKNMVILNVPKKYFCHFVRGHFDGDGNVWVGLIHKGREVRSLTIQVVFTSCSEIFLFDLKTKLDQFGIKKGVLRKNKGNFYRLVYSIIGSLKLYYFMYNGQSTSDLFLKRKKDVFEKYIKMRS